MLAISSRISFSRRMFLSGCLPDSSGQIFSGLSRRTFRRALRSLLSSLLFRVRSFFSAGSHLALTFHWLPGVGDRPLLPPARTRFVAALRSIVSALLILFACVALLSVLRRRRVLLLLAITIFTLLIFFVLRLPDLFYRRCCAGLRFERPRRLLTITFSSRDRSALRPRRQDNLRTSLCLPFRPVDSLGVVFSFFSHSFFILPGCSEFIMFNTSIPIRCHLYTVSRTRSTKYNFPEAAARRTHDEPPGWGNIK